MLSLLFLSVLIVFGNSDPNVFRLRDYKAGSRTSFDNVEPGAKLYLASNDDNEFLKNIEVISGGSVTTLDSINGYSAPNEPISLTITDGLAIRSTNIDTVTNVLTGYIYVTTRDQAKDPKFSVVVLKNRQAVTTTDQNSTVVVLNTQLISDSVDVDKPLKTSYVTSINQSPDTNMVFHWGFPAANWTRVNRFFENPLIWNNYDDNLKYFNTTRAFIDHVEPLQIGLDYWYITTAGSTVAMIMESKYVEDHEYTTTSVNSTGLIVNSFAFKKHVVNFQLDYTRSRTCGTLITVFPDSDDYISFYLEETNGGGLGQNYNKHAYVTHALSISPMQASKLTVNSTSLTPGVFYCQYYGFTGDLVPLTTSTAMQTSASTRSSSSMPSSTSTVMTTTKFSAAHSIIQIVSIIVAIVILR